jgi:hypothetical protein
MFISVESRAVQTHLGALVRPLRCLADRPHRLAQGYKSKAILALVEEHLLGSPSS